MFYLLALQGSHKCARGLSGQRDAWIHDSQVALGEHPGALIGTRPCRRLECELVSMAAHEQGLDRSVEIREARILLGLKRVEPIDATIFRGDIAIETCR